MKKTDKRRMERRQRRRENRQGDQNRAVNELNFRALPVRADTVDEENKSVQATLTTEKPTPMFDWERWEIVPEILRMDGMRSIPRNQVPLLDSHNRWSVNDQIGSVREIEQEEGQLAGTLLFSKSAAEIFDKVREGHLTDVSVGYRINKQHHVPKGETATVKGQEYTGPVNIVTDWTLKEASLTPIGADEQAKLRGYDPTIPLDDVPDEEMKMDPKLRARCVAAGMDEGLDDAASMDWLNANQEKLFETKAAPVASPTAKEIADELQARDQERQAKAAAFRKEVDDLIELAFGKEATGLDEFRTECYDCNDLMAARQKVMDRRDQGPPVQPGYQINLATDQPQDALQSDVGTAFLLRALHGAGLSKDAVDKAAPEKERGKGWETFRHASMLDMARECLIAEGYNVRGMSSERVAKAALGFYRQAGLQSRAGAMGYHTTGNFANLTRDAVNKSMAIAYQEAPATWRACMRQGDSVPDFKTIHRVQLGAVPNLPIWPDNTVPEESSFADQDTPYAVEAYSTKVSFSWRLVVNDDMSALSRVPAMLGRAAARTVNAKAWAQITANPTMADGISLFSAASGARKQQNLTTGAGTPTVANVGALKKLMRLVTGLNTPEANASDDILNLEPRYIIGPAALETTIEQLVNSIADPTANYSSAVYNPARTLVPVIEPLLDANSATAWYLSASPEAIDTVEVTFLAGQEEPVTNDWIDEETMAQCYIIVQTFAAKALEWRGLQKHAGA
jgi:hypothetical protein